jgi:acetyltransferase
MTIRNLEFMSRPGSVAVVGASDREGSVGGVVLKNIIEGGFEGRVYPINPKYGEVLGRTCYASPADLPEAPDLAVVVTPPQTVPGIIGELGARGVKAAVVITAGLNDRNGLRQKMLDAARPYTMRILGPNTVGLMIPPLKLNAGFAHMAAAAGDIALLSQSGAIATSLIDWAAGRGIGFSHIVSLGDMADVDVADYIDMLAGDGKTRAIMLYLESIPEPRKFMSAARAAARIKPVIAIKPGRHEQAAKAAATHTGALSGADRVVDAALRRAGILRVGGLAELFDAVEIVARFPPLSRVRVGIVTNGGGAGVLAVDQLMDIGGELAELSNETIATLNQGLPPTWSHANPVDIIGDAPAARYGAALKAVAADRGVDALLVLNCPTGLASPMDAARGVAAVVDKGRIGNKPVLACWLGEQTAEPARKVLREAGIATFETPAEAASSIGYLDGWSKAQAALTQVPASGSADIAGRIDEVRAIFRGAAAEGRSILTEPEAKSVLAAYDVTVPQILNASSPAQAEEHAAHLLKDWDRVVVKLLSKAISHKSDVGGVILNIETARAAREAAEAIEARVRASRPDADIEGYAVQPMVRMKHAHELILGVSRDPIFGPVIMFGAGGVSVEVVNDTAIGLPPLDDILGEELIERTRIGKLLAGFRDRAPADRTAILRSLNAVSQMVVDFPCIAGIDVNPLLTGPEGAVALDARIELDLSRIEEEGPNPDLAIRPYPSGWEKTFHSLKGTEYTLRPIRPADIALYPDFLEHVSAADIRLRFLGYRKAFPDEMLKRLTQLDYDREIAFVALDEDGALCGISRLSADPNHESAEFGLLVRSDLQGQGLGSALMTHLIEYGRADGLSRIEGIMFDENDRMIDLARDLGFVIHDHPDDSTLELAVLTLK